MSTKYKKGKTYEEMYGTDKANEYKQKLKDSRSKYKTEKERLGENYERVILILKNKFKGDNNPMRKQKFLWYFDPKTNKSVRIPENDKCPEGYIRGRKIKK